MRADPWRNEIDREEERGAFRLDEPARSGEDLRFASIAGVDHEASTLVDVLRQRAKYQPDRLAYVLLEDGETKEVTLLEDGETKEVTLTYAELDREARAIAALLKASGVAQGERALLIYNPGLEYISAFFGCLYAGVVAVPAYPPRPSRPMDRLCGIAVDSGGTVALTTASILSDIERRLKLAPDLRSLRWVATDTISKGFEEGWQDLSLDGDCLAFLQYTSGSTSAPKGVMLTHNNLLHNLYSIHERFEITSSDLGVSWLPPYHDMGLIGGVLQPVYAGTSTMLMTPIAFLQRPLRWLQAISKYKTTVSGGPNFAYDVCSRKIALEEREQLDLSSWAVAYTGVEPIRFETLERFATTFGPCGFRWESFYPCYGLAEATLLVSGGSREAAPVSCTIRGSELESHKAVVVPADDPGTRTLIGCGQTSPGQKIAVVDPESSTRCSPDRIGEIWVSGPSTARGYLGRPDDTAHTFWSYITDTGEGPFLRTGDLGFLQDDELFVTGRLKDLIVIRGCNHYPQDIEHTVEQSHAALRKDCGAAFSIEVGRQERLVVAHELERRCLRSINGDEVIKSIRKSVAEQHQLQVYHVALIKPGGIPKTSSGKIQRHACRTQFLEETLKIYSRSE